MVWGQGGSSGMTLELAALCCSFLGKGGAPGWGPVKTGKAGMGAGPAARLGSPVGPGRRGCPQGSGARWGSWGVLAALAGEKAGGVAAALEKPGLPWALKRTKNSEQCDAD